MYLIDDDSSEEKVIQKILAENALVSNDDPFYLVHVEKLVEQFVQWTENLPRVHPFYGECCA